MALSDDLKSLLLHGPHASHKKDLLRWGGAAHVLVQYRRHREEILALCPAGRRCWGFWILERRLKARPAGEIGELKLIRTLNLYRDHAERVFVNRRISELLELERQRRRDRPELRAVA